MPVFRVARRRPFPPKGSARAVARRSSLTATALTPEERVALREVVIERATIRPGDTDVDVASPGRTGQAARRVARVAWCT